MLKEVSESDLKALQVEHSKLITEYEDIIKEKIEIFNEMIDNLKSISDGNKQYIDNEEEIAEKKLSIEVWDRDIYQKKRVSMDVQVEIQNILNTIENEEKQISARDVRIEELQRELEEANAEHEEFQLDYHNRDEKIAELESQLNALEEERARLQAEEAERQRLAEEERRNRPKARIKYVPIKGDKVDEKMAVYINNFELDVPIQRIGDGQYMFGSRKIFAKIMNEKLVIRVGGGFMLIDEFLPTYGQQELDKMDAQEAAKNSFGGAGSPARRGSPNSSAMWAKTAGRQSPNASRLGSSQKKF